MHYFVNSLTSCNNWMKVAAVPVGALLWNSDDGWRRHICWRREKSLERIWDVPRGSESHLCFCLQLTFFIWKWFLEARETLSSFCVMVGRRKWWNILSHVLKLLAWSFAEEYISEGNGKEMVKSHRPKALTFHFLVVKFWTSWTPLSGSSLWIACRDVTLSHGLNSSRSCCLTGLDL